ncbi:hypothetical protein Avbf_11416 [Armadillidium vulgare]|nr:hypothetical protein Avbf_11416 [Armadillidium vulgare]
MRMKHTIQQRSNRRRWTDRYDEWVIFIGSGDCVIRLNYYIIGDVMNTRKHVIATEKENCLV